MDKDTDTFSLGVSPDTFNRMLTVEAVTNGHIQPNQSLVSQEMYFDEETGFTYFKGFIETNTTH